MQRFWASWGSRSWPATQTNKRIIEMGLETAIGEPCFPFKVAHGHYLDLIEKGIDIIFARASYPASSRTRTCGRRRRARICRERRT